MISIVGGFCGFTGNGRLSHILICLFLDKIRQEHVENLNKILLDVCVPAYMYYTSSGLRR